jgi:hypothetical protein
MVKHKPIWQQITIRKFMIRATTYVSHAPLKAYQANMTVWDFRVHLWKSSFPTPIKRKSTAFNPAKEV